MELSQDYNSYSPADHQTWSVLFEKQQERVATYAAAEFKKGFDLLSLDPTCIARLEQVNAVLMPVSGWSVIPASGLVSNKEFFFQLINKKFPITVKIRRPEELTFSELPDIFHDICGHVPMLMNNLFCEFMSEYSKIAINYLDDENAVTAFGRLYWFTLEMGLIREKEGLKPFGGAILTSSDEILNISHPDVPRHPFNLEQIIATPYDNLKLQKEYFYIESYEQLFDSLSGIRNVLGKYCHQSI
jgi:phenylalanine-4-hydroxylase